ncbi:hypothetical protein M0802_004573 [Mischocyttarus mexicanus]|nr:hypothetical protein M0802_004573 [Mischocyttarus mexicanus]
MLCGLDEGYQKGDLEPACFLRLDNSAVSQISVAGTSAVAASAAAAAGGGGPFQIVVGTFPQETCAEQFQRTSLVPIGQSDVNIPRNCQERFLRWLDCYTTTGSQRMNETNVCKTNKDDDSLQGSQDMVHGILGERKSKEYAQAEKSHKFLGSRARKSFLSSHCQKPYRDSDGYEGGDWSRAKKDVPRDVCLDENEGNTSPRISHVINSFYSLGTSN